MTADSLNVEAPSLCDAALDDVTGGVIPLLVIGGAIFLAWALGGAAVAASYSVPAFLNHMTNSGAHY